MARLPSVTFTAWTRPSKWAAAAKVRDTSAPRGGVTSAVMANPPRAKTSSNIGNDSLQPIMPPKRA